MPRQKYGNGHGEHPEARGAMDRLTKRHIDAGYSPSEAARISKNIARRVNEHNGEDSPSTRSYPRKD